MVIDFHYFNGGGGSGSGVTPEEVQEQINSALTPYTPTSGFSTINGSAITEGDAIVIDEPDLSGYWTSAQTQSALDAKQDVIADLDSIRSGAQAGSTAVQPAALADYVDNTELQSTLAGYYTSAQTDNLISNFVSSADVKTQIESSLTSYTPTSGFATVNGSAITSGGNLVIEEPDLSAYWTSAETQAHIDSAYTSATTHIEDVERVTAAALNELHSEVDAISGASENYITSAYVNTALASYTPTSGFSTINGSAITAGGNLVIEGGSGNANIIELTKAEYNALSAYTEDAIYVITDADAINMDDYATSANVNTALASYTPTSGFSTINGSAITAGGNLVIDADLTNYWDSAQTQAHIDSAYTSATTHIEDVERVAASALNELHSEVAAISASTANMVTSTTVSVLWKGTQAQYDQISPKDPNTLYIIISA